MPAQNVDERTIEILASIFSAVQGVWAHSQYIMRDGGVYPSESHAARRECSLSFHQRGVLGVIRAPAEAGALLEAPYISLYGGCVGCSHTRQMAQQR